MAKKILYWVSLVLFFSILTVIFTWPLARFFNTAIIGQSDFTDGPFFLWNLWWVKKALLAGQNPFYTTFVYYPAMVNMSLHTLTFTNAIIGIPISSFINLIATQNLIIIASLVASAVGMVRLVGYLTGNKFAGILSGIIFAFSPNMAAHLMAGHYNLVAVWAIPFIILFLFKTMRERSYLNPILLGLFLSAQFYQDLQMASVLGIIFMVIFLFFTITEPKKTFSSRNLLYYLISALVFLVIFVLPFMAIFDSYWGHKIAELTFNNGDLSIIFGPNPLNPIFRHSGYETLAKMIGSYRENTITLGFSVLTLAALSFFFRKKIKDKICFGIIFLIGLALALGPYLQINSISYPNIKLPFFWVQKLPLFNIGVVPTRYILIASFALAVLGGFLLSDLIASMHKKHVLPATIIFVLLSCGLVSFEYYSGPLKMDKIEVSPIYSSIAKEEDSFTVLPVFAGPRDAYFQTFHSKKVVSGYLGRRIHLYYLTKYYGEPGIGPLVFGNLDNIYLTKADFDVNLVRQTYKKYKIKYVFVDKTNFDHPEASKKAENYLGRTLGFPVYARDQYLTVFKVD